MDKPLKESWRLSNKLARKVEAIGIVIEKSFQDGRGLLEKTGIPVFFTSTPLERFENGQVVFKEAGLIMQQQEKHSKAMVLWTPTFISHVLWFNLVPMMIGKALGYNSEQLTYLVSTDIFMCGMATFYNSN